MAIKNIYSFDIAPNVCRQMLRELERGSKWSMAHVTMNPLDDSLFHEHRKMHEIYIITKGRGKLFAHGFVFNVQAGDAFWIPPGTGHKLTNTGVTSLEHLVLASPPFNPADVFILDQELPIGNTPVTLIIPTVQDCFDGAKIIPYDFPKINTSVAFGWVTADPKFQKPPHLHKKTEEWIFVIEGHGWLKTKRETVPINSGDWIYIKPGRPHALLNSSGRHLVVVCFCTPSFSMDDTYFC